MNWDEAYKQLQKSDPQPEDEYEYGWVHNMFSVLFTAVMIGVVTGAIFFGYKLMVMFHESF